MEMRGFVPRDADNVEVSCKFISAACIHLVGDVYGQLRGVWKRQWSGKQMRPHALQLAALQSMSRERAVTGNMLGLPTQASARRISSQQQLMLRRKKDMLASLQDMCRTADTGPWLSSLSLKPASVLIIHDSEFAACCVCNCFD
jgi:hypothetical protein